MIKLLLILAVSAFSVFGQERGSHSSGLRLAITNITDNYTVQPGDVTVIFNGTASGKLISLPLASAYPGKVLFLRDVSGFGFNVYPPMPDLVIVESRSGGFNYSAYVDSSFGVSTLKSTAPGCSSTNIGSRYAFTNTANIVLKPSLANTGAVYLVELTKGTATSVSGTIMANAVVSGGMWTNMDGLAGMSNLWTAAFQSSGPNTWKAVGYLALTPGVTQPTITFTTTNTDFNVSSNRWYSDAFRFTSGNAVVTKGSTTYHSDGQTWWPISNSRF